MVVKCVQFSRVCFSVSIVLSLSQVASVSGRLETHNNILHILLHCHILWHFLILRILGPITKIVFIKLIALLFQIALIGYKLCGEFLLAFSYSPCTVPYCTKLYSQIKDVRIFL